MRIGITAGLMASVLAPAVAAQNQLQTTRAVYIERPSNHSSGKIIEPASDLRRGDKVLLVVEWPTGQGSGGYTISSAVPKQLAFQRSSLDADAVSVDGGRNWGQLGHLRIRSSNGHRLASVEDVTHLRWRVPQSHAGSGKGRITYSAIVR